MIVPLTGWKLIDKRGNEFPVYPVALELDTGIWWLWTIDAIGRPDREKLARYDYNHLAPK